MMKYESARESIRAGDLLGWTHRGWGSWYDLKVQMVRTLTQSEYSHVGLAWPVGGRVFVLEAVIPGIRIYPLSKLLPFYWCRLDADWSDEVEEFALSCVGEPYSQFQAIAAGLGRLDVGADRTWQCAEYVLEVLRRASVPLAAARATPSDVVNAALATDAATDFNIVT